MHAVWKEFTVIIGNRREREEAMRRKSGAGAEPEGRPVRCSWTGVGDRLESSRISRMGCHLTVAVTLSKSRDSRLEVGSSVNLRSGV